MNRYQAAAIILGLLVALGYGAAGVAVFRAWLDGTPPGGLAATVSALSAIGFACMIADRVLKGAQSIRRAK